MSIFKERLVPKEIHPTIFPLKWAFQSERQQQLEKLQKLLDNSDQMYYFIFRTKNLSLRVSQQKQDARLKEPLCSFWSGFFIWQKRMGIKTEDPQISFFTSLYQHCSGGFINLRLIPQYKNKHIVQKFIQLSEKESIQNFLNRYNNQQYNCYFGVSTRLAGCGSKEAIIQIPALWVDMDTYKLNSDQVEESRQRYKDFHLKTTFTINSGKGHYILWLLKEPASKEEIPKVENLLKRLASYFYGDQGATDASRILRIPGTVNYKYSPCLKVTLISSELENQYSLQDFEKVLPPIEAPDKEKDPHPEKGWWQELLKGVSKGKRNTSIVRLAGRYLEKGLSRDEILPILLDANSHFSPPLAVKEILTCLDSVIKTHRRNQPKDAPDQIAKSSFLPTLSDIYDLDIKVEWLVGKLIPKQAVTVLHGKGGVGKTYLMLQLGSSVAKGVPFCGFTTQKMPVYYIDFENPMEVLHDRALVLGRSPLLVWHMSNRIPPPRLDSKEKEWLRYRDLPPGLLIFDTLRQAFSGDENSSRDIALVMMRLKGLRDLGFTPLLIHHTPKSDERIYKGSTAIQDLCDHVLSLDEEPQDLSNKEKGENERILRLGVRGKTRYEPSFAHLRFNPKKGFDTTEPPPDQDEEPLKEIHLLIINFEKREISLPNQTQLRRLAKNKGINKKRFDKLLKKGEGRFWKALRQPKSRVILYEPIR